MGWEEETVGEGNGCTPVRLLIYGPYGPTEFPLESGTFTLGRSPEVDIVVDDPSLSRVHAEIEVRSVTPVRIGVRDLNSRNGTYAEGIRLEGPLGRELESGDLIEAGHTALVVHEGKRKEWEDAQEGAVDLCSRLNELCLKATGFWLLLVKAPLSEQKRIPRVLKAFATHQDEFFQIDGHRHVLLMSNADEKAALRGKRALDFALTRHRVDAEIECISHRDGDSAEDLFALLESDISRSTDLELSHLVVLDPRMRETYQLVDRFAATDLSVLVLGETGVGKEVVARAIHDRSSRRKSRFLALNCAGVPETLLESELFGHRRGAFSGADADRQGLIEATNGGTVFLDEVAEMPPAIQAKLLRVVEEGAIRRLGDVESRPVDVRFVSATLRDLQDEVRAGNFREDLFYRLAGASITIPPLRDRQEEIIPLAHVFANAVSKGGSPPDFSSAAVRVLKGHRWSGNVRELKNVVERAVALSGLGPIEPAHLGLNEPCPEERSVLSGRIDEVERQIVVDALESCGGNQTKAAELLGVSRKTFIRRLDRYRIPRPRRKSSF